MTNETNNTQPTETVKAILIGRHTDEIPGVEIVKQINAEWSLHPASCDEQLWSMCNEAKELGVALIFQNVPGVLAGALMRMCRDKYPGPVGTTLGVVVSKPGPRTAGVRKTFTGFGDGTALDAAADAVKFANPRAKVTTPSTYELIVEVDPIAPFEFVRIEWLY